MKILPYIVGVLIGTFLSACAGIITDIRMAAVSVAITLVIIFIANKVAERLA